MPCLTSIVNSHRRWYKRIAVYQRRHIIVRHTNSSSIEHKESRDNHCFVQVICPSFANHGFNGIQMIYNTSLQRIQVMIVLNRRYSHYLHILPPKQPNIQPSQNIPYRSHERIQLALGFPQLIGLLDSANRQCRRYSIIAN